jgi:hypothetical protein
MNKEELKKDILEFLYLFPYNVMHEINQSQTKEIFFVAIEKKDIRKTSLKEFFHLYEQSFPLNMVSKESQNYFKNNSNKFYFIFVENLDIKDLFFEQKKQKIEQNANNIIAIRTTGQAADKIENLEYQTKEKFSQLQEISKGLFKIFKDDTVKKFEKTKPILKNKINILKNKITTNS